MKGGIASAEPMHVAALPTPGWTGNPSTNGYSGYSSPLDVTGMKLAACMAPPHSSCRRLVSLVRITGDGDLQSRKDPRACYLPSVSSCRVTGPPGVLLHPPLYATAMCLHRVALLQECYDSARELAEERGDDTPKAQGSLCWSILRQDRALRSAMLAGDLLLAVW